MMAQSLTTTLVSFTVNCVLHVILTLPLVAQDNAPFVTPKIDPSKFRELKTTNQQQGKQIQVDDDKVAELQKALDAVTAELQALKKVNQNQKISADKVLRKTRVQESNFQKQMHDQNQRMEALMKKIKELSKRDRVHDASAANNQISVDKPPMIPATRETKTHPRQ